MYLFTMNVNDWPVALFVGNDFEKSWKRKLRLSEIVGSSTDT